MTVLVDAEPGTSQRFAADHSDRDNLPSISWASSGSYTSLSRMSSSLVSFRFESDAIVTRRSDAMKIAIVAHLKYPIVEPFAGGLEAQTSTLMTGLERAGHGVVLFAAAGSAARDLRVVCAPTGALAPEIADRLEAEAYGAILDRLQSEAFDVVHFNALHFRPIDEAARVPAPMVAVLHCPPFAPLARAMNAAPRNVTLVSVSAALSTQWPDLSREPIVIDNGVDLERFRFDAGSGAPGSALWCGRIVPEKGLHLAIDAARAAGVALKVCGPIVDRDYWTAEVAPRLGSEAVYLGHLGHNEVAALLAKAAVLVCTPCWEEPFGLVVVEALACGTPVAGFARGALVDILDANCGVLAAPADVAGLALAIRAALLLDRHGCRARAEVFGTDLMIARYVALYRTLIVAADEAKRRDRLLDDVDAG